MSEKPKKRWVGWKTLVVLAFVLGAWAAIFCLALSKTHERQEFIGNVDPKTGYRCRFTLSSDWQRKKLLSRVGEVWLFTPPLNTIRQRMYMYLFPKTIFSVPSISFGDSTSIVRAQTHLAGGYPDPNLPRSVHIDSLRHLVIDGFPATVTTTTTEPLHAISLSVYVPQASGIYSIGGIATGANFALADREMQAIISSFHIEKVTSPRRKR